MSASCLDVTSAAQLAINYFNGHMDRRSGYPFIWTYLLTDPPKMSHDGWDTVEVVGRFLEGLVPLRVMTGSEAGVETEILCRDALARCQRNDGFIYRPKLSYTVPIADYYDQMSAIQGLVVRFLADRDPVCARVIDANIAALGKAVSWDGNEYARFLHVGVKDGRPLDRYDGEVTENDNPEAPDEAWFGRLIRPALQYAEATGKEEPLVLARAVARDIAFRSGRYGEDGSFSRALFGEDSVWTNGHFHSRANAVAAILRLARVAGDKDLFEWAERVFRWALRHGTSFGWFPEFVGRRDVEVEGAETCGIVDMFDSAVTLARAGRNDCWEVADRIWRNQMLENQLRDVSWVRATSRKPDTAMEVFDQVPQLALGGFAGWAGPNDFISDFEDIYFALLDPSQDHRRSLMGCCSSSGAKGLYLAWHRSVDEGAEVTSVNFTVSRECPSASIRAWETFDGRIEVRLKTDRSLRVRVPGGVKHDQVRIAVDDRPKTPVWEGDFACLKGLRRGQQVTVRYPLVERTEKVTVGGWDFTTPVEYEVTWRGNTVVEIGPHGRHCPLYRRKDAFEKEPKDAPADLACPTNEFEY